MIKKTLIFTLTIGIILILILLNSFFSTKKEVDYSNCELGDLVGDDVVRTYLKEFYIDYHSSDYTESKAKELAQECLDENIKSQYEMDCCLRYKMFPTD